MRRSLQCMEGCLDCERVLHHRMIGLLIFRGWSVCLALLHPLNVFEHETCSAIVTGAHAYIDACLPRTDGDA